MRLTQTMLILALFAFGCTTPASDTDGGDASTGAGWNPDLNSYEERSADAVDAVVVPVLKDLGLTVISHEFDGGTGLAIAVSPSGATTEVRWYWVLKDVTYLEVETDRYYGEMVSDKVMYQISVALNYPG